MVERDEGWAVRGGAGARATPWTSPPSASAKSCPLEFEGLTARKIGERMHLAEKTVKHSMSNFLGKLQVRRRVEAELIAARVEWAKG